MAQSPKGAGILKEGNQSMNEITPIIPEGKIAWLVGEYHVATDFEVIKEDLNKRMTDPYWTEEHKQAVYDYALQVHNHNRRVYNSVLSGRVSNDLLG